jgi:hypothetical protein
MHDKTPIETVNQLLTCTLDEFVYVFVRIDLAPEHFSIASKFAGSESRTYDDCRARFRELHPAFHRASRVVHEKGTE